MKIGEIIAMLERDGWALKRVSGSPIGISFIPRNLAW
jgi:hypothetical protein